MNQPFRAVDIPDQSGRTAIITGGNSGIGYYTALELARKGAQVIIACRSAAKGKQAVERIEQQVPAAKIQVQMLDLSSQRSIHAFAREWLGAARSLDLLINNAGVMALPKRVETEDGFEMQFGTNVLGHFALTGLLLPAMSATAKASSYPPRVVTLASIAHLSGHIHLDDLQSEKRYSAGAAYSQSKLADLMLALELDRRLRDCGSQIVSVAAHPGVANTNLFQRDAPRWQLPMRKITGGLIGTFLNSAEQGALPTLYAATDANIKPGGYYGPQGFREMRGEVGEAKISDRAQNRAMAAQLWEKCEQLTGVSFP